VILSIGKKAQEIRDKAEETFTVGAKKMQEISKLLVVM
jgi:hypothetical protein